MKWPLLGIIAVVCLHVAYTAFNALDRSLESLVAINALIRGTNAVAGMPTSAMQFDNDFADHSARRNKAAAIVSSVGPRKSVRSDILFALDRQARRSTPIMRQRAMQHLVAMQRPFESIVITYPRPISAVSESENYAISTRAIALPEKRSFISKTGSVLKKPYTWLKALGSKF